jgi:hypothetical protein
LFRDPKPQLSRGESLKGIPVRGENVEDHEGPEGERMLIAPRKAPAPEFLKRLAGNREPEPAKIVLDRYGSTVWGLIDGKRNVKSIVTAFAEEFGLHRREAEAGVVEFLNMLMKRGLIAIAFK